MPPVSRGTESRPASIFTVFADEEGYRTAVRDFLATPAPTTVPVWLGDRADLVASAERAAALYATVARPTPYARGVLLGEHDLPAGLVELIRPMAAQWVPEDRLDAQLFATDPGARSLLVVGVYDKLTLGTVRETALAAYAHPGLNLAFLTGRDAASLAWFTAKQYAAAAPEVTELGLFTATDRPVPVEGVRVFDERRLEADDIQAQVLDPLWRRVLFQGHGKDDSVNLAEFTLCGLSTAAPRRADLLGPRCAYGPDCYKPKDKLIRLHEVRAVEVVLSSCNSGPLADAVVYDPKYQLMLNAIDGPAKDVVAALTVHDSDRPENDAWMRGALAGTASTPVLNASIGTAQPYPAFVHYGLADDTGSAPESPAQRPDPLLLTTSTRLTAYLASDLLPHNNPLRPRLEKLARKVERWVTRQEPTAQGPERIHTDLTADLQSLDHTIGTVLAEDPENELADYPGHFGVRSVLDESSVRTVECTCGRPAQEFTKKALVPTALDTLSVICLRCGDVSFRIPGAPAVWIDAEDEAAAGETIEVRVRVQAQRKAAVNIGLFVPRYLRSDCEIQPARQKVKVAPGKEAEASFRLTVDPNTPSQAYYMTAFAVQDLGVSTARRHFGVTPAEPAARGI
ncbi:hypothetical protein [Streptomyces sp. NPDC048710]|uniref:hypothetical protein n=1 Tax=Streptomyces sp. NPDC048710 TaxID=3365586 RepID=UPI00371B2A51